MVKKYEVKGEFEIEKADSEADGFYAEGRMVTGNMPYPKLAGSGRYFLKAGADAPETLLAYRDFDGTVARKKGVPLKSWSPHLKDWKAGDPTWKGGKGKGLIGALNYLSEMKMNAFSFLTYNAGGDGDNVWPFVERDRKLNYDVSKLDQWNVVFTHAQAKGLFLHFKMQETEIDDNRRGHKKMADRRVPEALDSGKLGVKRKLYCRELVARFSHHLALNWNLGEENTQTTEEIKAMGDYIRAIDPYDHHVVVHTYPDQQDKVYRPFLGKETLSGISLQNSALKDCHWQVLKWRKEAKKAGRDWAVAFDEPGNAQFGMPADPDYPGMPSGQDYDGPTVDETRKFALWGTLMAGGWGVEYYFGYKLPQNDLVCEDWRSREQSWKYAAIALEFFGRKKVHVISSGVVKMETRQIPFWEMENRNDLVGNPKNENTVYCLAKRGMYVVYFIEGKKVTLKPMEGDEVETVRWFNPRTGKDGQVEKVVDGVLTPPDGEDWVGVVE